MNRDLFQYLSDVAGSEKIVEVRRLFFKVLDGCFNNIGFPITLISSGSKAEGLDLPGSDFDIMHVLNYINVCDAGSDISSNIAYNLVVDTENATPGFVLLKSPFNINYFNSVERTIHGAVLCNDQFRSYWKTKQNRYHKLYKRHGPCLSAASDNLDLAYCLKGDFWPSVAAHWIQRPHSGNWPSSAIISEIVQSGILFVPIGSKFGATKDNRFEWRMSFSVAEKILIHSFNHTQLLCYAMLKIVLKQVINTNKHSKDFLCSYYMKTVMFWMVEELENAFWIPENLFECFKACLKRVIYLVQRGYCPNYFIPQNNMFEGKIEMKHKERHIVRVLEELCVDGVTLFTNSESLIGYLQHRSRDGLAGQSNTPDEISKVDSALYSLMSAIHVLPHFNDLCGKSLINGIIRAGKHKNGAFSELQKDLKVLVISYIIGYFCRHLQYPFNINNKLFSVKYKELLCYLVIGTKFDISGWLWLGVFFYTHERFIRTLCITRNILSECSPNKILISTFPNQYSSFSTKLNINKELSFLQRHRLLCLHEMNELLREGTLLHGTDLNSMSQMIHVYHPIVNESVSVYMTKELMDSMVNNISCTPVEFVHFLRFMCYHHLNAIKLRFDSFIQMVMAVQSLPQYCSLPFTSVHADHLMKAAQLMDNPNAMKLAASLMLRQQKIVGQPHRNQTLASFPSYFPPEYEEI